MSTKPFYQQNSDPGFDYSVLCEFRARLIAGCVEQILLDAMLARLRELGLLKSRGRQCTDSTHVLAAVRAVNRLESVGETLRATLNTLAAVAPDWLVQQPTPSGRIAMAERSTSGACQRVRCDARCWAR